MRYCGKLYMTPDFVLLEFDYPAYKIQFETHSEWGQIISSGNTENTRLSRPLLASPSVVRALGFLLEQ